VRIASAVQASSDRRRRRAPITPARCGVEDEIASIDKTDRGDTMMFTAIPRSLRWACGLLVAALATGCAGMSACEVNTATGAAIGGVAGSVLTEGSTVGTVGGAVAGGVIGNRTTRHPC
jgi:osmotically inducible lipoprotein OsmB